MVWNIYSGLSGLNPKTAKELEASIKSIDTDGSGTVNYTGYIILRRVHSGNDGEKYIHEGWEALYGIQDVW